MRTWVTHRGGGCGEGPLVAVLGALTTRGCRAVKGVRVGETGTEGVCWGPEDTAHPRNQGAGKEEAIEIGG